MDSNKIFSKRIRLVCQYLTAGGGTLEDMLEWVNRGLDDQGLKPIELRTLQECIFRLRHGNFEHSLQDEPKHKRSRLFKVEVEAKKYYRWAKDTMYPVFGDLDEEERFTLPFLAGILERYRSIPAVQKILDQLPEIFNIRLEEMKSSAAIVHSGPVLFDDQNPDYQEKVIHAVIRILSHIHRGEAIEFIYSKVNQADEMVLNQVAPLQIRYYEHYYYLIATDLKGERIVNYRVDQIHRLKVDLMKDEEDKPVLFDQAEFEKSSELRDRFQDSIGVWAHKAEEKLHEVHVEFSAWAATYMRHLRFHKSQRIVKEDKAANQLVLSYRLRLRAERVAGQPVLERNSELAFLLGRFREFARVISCKPL